MTIRAPSALLALLLVGVCAAANPADALHYPGLGTVSLESPAGDPTGFAVFLSGDGGWNQGVVAMARHLAAEGVLVAGVDLKQMQRQQEASNGKCVASAELLEGLSHFVQQRYGMKQYATPVLVGYSSGATLAYATLVEAPAGTFRGALSLGFCPDLDWTRPLCRGEALAHDVVASQRVIYRPAERLGGRWIALQGEQDQVCDAGGTREFVARVPGAEVVMLPKVGHGFSVERNWLPQFLAAYRKVAATGETDRPVAQSGVGDLPLVELRPQGPERNLLAIILSGDGGWAGLDKEVAARLTEHGVPVVGWDSLRYFWHARTPEVAARDLGRVIEHYTQSWGKSAVLLVGYSQGADVMPFMVNRLPEPLRRKIESTALIGLSPEAFFEFSVSHWIATPSGGRPVLAEIERGQMGRVACIYGAEEDGTLCRRPGIPGMRAVELPGGHHFDGDYERVAAAVLEGLPQ